MGPCLGGILQGRSICRKPAGWGSGEGFILYKWFSALSWHQSSWQHLLPGLLATPSFRSSPSGGGPERPSSEQVLRGCCWSGTILRIHWPGGHEGAFLTLTGSPWKQCGEDRSRGHLEGARLMGLRKNLVVETEGRLHREGSEGGVCD